MKNTRRTGDYNSDYDKPHNQQVKSDGGIVDDGKPADPFPDKIDQATEELAGQLGPLGRTFDDLNRERGLIDGAAEELSKIPIGAWAEVLQLASKSISVKKDENDGMQMGWH